MLKEGLLLYTEGLEGLGQYGVHACMAFFLSLRSTEMSLHLCNTLHNDTMTRSQCLD